MADHPLNFFDYVKAAFNQKVNIPGLGPFPVNKILLGTGIVLGLGGNPGFWFLTLALELGYLFALASSHRYQKLIQATQMNIKTEEWGEKQSTLLASLDNESRERYRHLLDNCAVIVKVTESDKNISDGDFRTSGLNQLVWMFLKLLSSRKKMKAIIAGTSMPELETEIKEITDKISKEPQESALQRSLQGTLDIQKRRLENLVKAKESLKVAEAELNRIEKQVTLLNEEASVSSDPELVSLRLDNVMTSLSGTSKWMTEQGEIFGMQEEGPVPENLIRQSIRTRQMTE